MMLTKNEALMNNFEFIEYIERRYDIDFTIAETLVDIFSDCLQELLQSGQSVEIDGVGKFQQIPLFPNGLNHQNQIALARLAKKKMVSFKASEDLAA